MTQREKLAREKMSLNEQAGYLRILSEACRVMGENVGCALRTNKNRIF
jgi:hypothetical protein